MMRSAEVMNCGRVLFFLHLARLHVNSGDPQVKHLTDYKGGGGAAMSKAETMLITLVTSRNVLEFDLSCFQSSMVYFPRRRRFVFIELYRSVRH